MLRHVQESHDISPCPSKGCAIELNYTPPGNEYEPNATAVLKFRPSGQGKTKQEAFRALATELEEIAAACRKYALEQ